MMLKKIYLELIAIHQELRALRQQRKPMEVEINMITRPCKVAGENKLKEILKKIEKETEEYPCVKVKIAITQG